ncbi:MAG: DNA polymerase III subunit beta [Deinococcales bacterium]
MPLRKGCLRRTSLAKKYLADALAHVERIIPARSSNPALSLLRLESQDGAISFSGSNLDIDIKAKIAADTETDAVIALPAQVFGQVVRALPGELVELVVEDRELEIRSGSFATKLQLSDASQTLEPSFPSNYQSHLSAEDLAKALQHVRYAAAVAEYQAIFRGVKLELSDRHLRAIATDGFRLAYYNIAEPSGMNANIVIPARSVEELSKILGEGDAHVNLDNNQLSVKSGIYSMNVKLLEGDFPNYERVIPQHFVMHVSLDSKALLDSCIKSGGYGG